ncbi:hypothetical protein ACOSQ3_005741 [Xanthoceras sorbifolium]
MARILKSVQLLALFFVLLLFTNYSEVMAMEATICSTTSKTFANFQCIAKYDDSNCNEDCKEEGYVMGGVCRSTSCKCMYFC